MLNDVIVRVFMIFEGVSYKNGASVPVARLWSAVAAFRSALFLLSIPRVFSSSA